MSLQIDSLFVDEELGDAGVWVNFYNGSRLKLASSENAKYKAYMAKLARKHRLELDQSNDDSTALIQDITAEALSKHVLLDWEKVSIGGDEDAAYTPELGKLAILKAPKLKDFILDQAADNTNFKKKQIEQVKKPTSGS